ncbi:MAG: cupredoxin domain-containing protein [Vicinamibacterales bacterium]
MFGIRYSYFPKPASTLLNCNQVLLSLTFLKDSVAAAGTALLLGAAAMSSQQDLAAAFAPSIAQDRPAGAPGEPREITIVAKRFTFEPERVEVTEGERVRLVLTSADGVHGVEIKKFKVNKKIPRGGDPVTIEFVATAAGQYPILCSEYCGKDHDAMKGVLVVNVKP